MDRADERSGSCFVRGRLATTKEHIIHKWLQGRFSLWDERLELPNKTTIPYRQAIVPSCARCNGEVYGTLEKKVENDTATESEIWRWANKIHYALVCMDKFLAWDRAHPGLKIGKIIKPHDPIERDRHLLHCVSRDFNCDPDPFGSVFKFNFRSCQRFWFAHFIRSQSICVSLGHIGYVVFISDGQVIKREVDKSPCRIEDMLFFYAQCLENMARQTVSQTIVMSHGLIAQVGTNQLLDSEPINKERFRAFCEALNLEWLDSDGLNDDF